MSGEHMKHTQMLSDRRPSALRWMLWTMLLFGAVYVLGLAFLVIGICGIWLLWP
jgi:hypothetical protein